MKGKRIVVTGGTTGIGRATIARLASRGARIVTVGRDEDALKEALADLADLPGEVGGVVADLGTRQGIEHLFAEADARLGGLDAIVSNAALGAEPIDEMAEEDWRYVVEVNLVGAMSAVHAALKRFDDGGQVVIVGSISAHIHAPGESVYSATKAGLQAFSETLRKEVAERKVRVGLIEPGTVGTDMCPAVSKRRPSPSSGDGSVTACAGSDVRIAWCGLALSVHGNARRNLCRHPASDSARLDPLRRRHDAERWRDY
jgi:NAD(P)-dependent dehydrogenase (short-subunit alcohol dehydrogenase family)